MVVMVGVEVVVMVGVEVMENSELCTNLKFVYDVIYNRAENGVLSFICELSVNALKFTLL